MARGKACYVGEEAECTGRIARSNAHDLEGPNTMSGVLNSDSFFRDSEVAPETALATATAFATADSAPAAGRAVDTTMTFGGPGSGILA
eukprot:CAMPEP_0204134372 /NCGR_PEP_ID=MMETSP0361-20130328/15633_1 /ASSEMBLY_ACC=CAM_ASM_000343 /TAXON_ID=268821 /ORGANISM="Scrippsiella Hangoei, Strain SHTV-5" /LENGTH=88 /DNA_ID=CAMNT_0051087563 /DNA_START=49 /DNA_END=313 /DNA_ORIENTATION=+